MEMTDPLIMPDSRLETFGLEYRTICNIQGRNTMMRGNREIPFHRFLADRIVAENCNIYSRCRNVCRIREIESIKLP